MSNKDKELQITQITQRWLATATGRQNEAKKKPQITQITQIKKIEREAIEHKRSP